MRVTAASPLGWFCRGSLLVYVFSGAYAFQSNVHDHGTVSITRERFLQLPLVPHHIQRRRLQHERALTKQTHDVDATDKLNQSLRIEEKKHQLVDGERPRRYPRRRMANANQVAELFQGYGTHYVDLWVGTPPQRQTVIVDTGSGVTAFPCSGCKDCGVPKYHSDGLFEQGESSSFKKLTCDECLRGHCGGQECKISMSYQEGSSWNAFEAEDQCYAGGLHSTSVSLDDKTKEDDLNPFLAPKYAFPLKFGCQTKITGLFVTQLADGIMGLDNAQASYVKQMRKSGLIPSETFSLCYSRQDSVDPDGTESGAFTLGGSDERLRNSPQVFTGGTGSKGFYAVRIRNFYLRAGSGGISAKSSDEDAKVISLGIGSSTLRGQVIVDSGTTDTYFGRALGGQFNKVFEQLSGKKYTHAKQKMTLEEVQQLPTILIQLEGDEDLNKKVRRDAKKPVVGLSEEVDPANPYDVLLAVPPTHYMEYDPDDDVWTARFYTDEPSGGVIGGNGMMGHDVFFDVDNQRIGWAEAECDYTALLKKYGYDKDKVPAPSEPVEPQPSPTPPPVAPAPDLPTYTAPPAFSPGIDVNDDKFDKEDDPGFCTTLPCQSALASIVVLIVACCALQYLNNRNKGAYSQAEMELSSQMGSSKFTDSDDGFSDRPYSDDVDDVPPDSFEDEDDAPKISRV